MFRRCPPDLHDPQNEVSSYLTRFALSSGELPWQPDTSTAQSQQWSAPGRITTARSLLVVFFLDKTLNHIVVLFSDEASAGMRCPSRRSAERVDEDPGRAEHQGLLYGIL